ncbi:MAG: hypothetical protein NT166_06485 [Candidatus Aminicenantes bacterium]|nr:hypothetical protein [Candidatus Aminicenantes bacterium]
MMKKTFVGIRVIRGPFFSSRPFAFLAAHLLNFPLLCYNELARIKGVNWSGKIKIGPGIDFLSILVFNNKHGNRFSS